MRNPGQWHVGSALTSDEFVAIRSVGFEPVGQVLALRSTASLHRRLQLPGAWGSYGYGIPARTVTQVSGRGGFGSFAPLVQTMYEARHKALDRMTAECAELGGHGVVGVKLTIGSFPAGGMEFKAIGTAIRAPGAPPVFSGTKGPRGRPARRRSPPTCPAGFRQAHHEGWVPAGLVLAFRSARGTTTG